MSEVREYNAISLKRNFLTTSCFVSIVKNSNFPLEYNKILGIKLYILSTQFAANPVHLQKMKKYKKTPLNNLKIVFVNKSNIFSEINFIISIMSWLRFYLRNESRTRKTQNLPRGDKRKEVANSCCSKMDITCISKKRITTKWHKKYFWYVHKSQDSQFLLYTLIFRRRNGDQSSQNGSFSQFSQNVASYSV